jgi:hypothetical protein
MTRRIWFCILIAMITTTGAYAQTIQKKLIQVS